MKVSRSTFLGLIKASARMSAVTSQPTPDISEIVKSLMPKDGHARLAYGLGGGDEEHTYAVWHWTDKDDRQHGICLMSLRTRLWELDRVA